MKSLSLLLVVSAALIVGCHPRPEDARDAGAPGPVRGVDLGGITNANVPTDSNSAPRVVPIRDWVKPAVPLVEPPQVISIWFYPRKSLDGLSYREGFWCHRVVRAFSWGQERVMTEQGVNLDNGQIVRDRVSLTPGEQTSIEPQAWFLEAMGSTSRGIPATERSAPAVRTIPQISTPSTGSSK